METAQRNDNNGQNGEEKNLWLKRREKKTGQRSAAQTRVGFFFVVVVENRCAFGPSELRCIGFDRVCVHISVSVCDETKT